MKRQNRPDTARPRPAAGPRSAEGGRPAEDRNAYRRVPASGAGDKKADVGAGTGDLEFVS